MISRCLHKLPRRAVICLVAATLLCTTFALQAESAGKPPFDRSVTKAFSGQSLPTSLDDLQRVGSLDKGRLNVMIELEAPPTTVVYAQAQTEKGLTKARAAVEAQTHLAKVELAQQEILTILEQSFEVEVLYSLQRTYNGIAAQVDVRQLAELRRLAGVKGVHFLPEHELTNSTSVPFIGVPGVWDALGLDGSGVSIGVIDTGIDYIHTNFGGSGDLADYAANDTTILDGFFPTAKVVGGFDFAGDDYNASDPANNVPAPDPDPLDCNGHGSHVAGSASGLGVNADGSTFPGPYDDDIDFAALKLGPGTAPAADLYALRVFGCVGSTVLTAQAIEWAVDPDGDGDFSDHLDVINMSLGSDFGSPVDPTVLASNNAALAGVIVVASSGNSGDTYFITGSPGVAARAISVAASVDDGLVAARARVHAPPALADDYLVGTATFGPSLTEAGTTGDVAEALDADDDGGTTTDGCSPLTNPAEVAGKIALIDRGTCNFTVKVKNAQDAGAIAAIIVNNQGDFAFNLGGTDPAITIPSVGIAQDVGDQMRAALPGVNVTLLLLPTPERADTLAGFSSRGPSRGTTPYLKPDISAPGLSITSALVGSGTETLTISGTSMASPHVAGVMALLRQAHPDWTVEELKALVMNTANKDLFFGDALTPPIYSGSRVGAGRVDPPDAATNEVLAYVADDSGRVSVSFATETVTEPMSEDKVVRIANKSGDDVTLDLSFSTLSDLLGVDFTLPDGDQVSVPAGGTADITVRMNADPSTMLHLPSPTIDLVQNGFPRHWLSEESANLRITSDSGVNLRLPLYAAPRPASTVRSLRRFLSPAHRFLLMRGDGVDTTALAAPPFGVLSLLSVFELQHISLDDPGTGGITNGADLAYVGVASDALSVQALGGGIGDSTVYFGIANHGDFSTPNEVEYDIFIDSNEDGNPDYLLFNGSFGRAIGAGADDVFITLLADLTTGSLFLADFVNGISAGFDTVLFNNSVMVLPVPAGLIGLSEADSSFEYFVLSGSREAGVADVTPVMHYDIASPGIDFSDVRNRSGVCPCPGPTIWVSEGGTGIPMEVNIASLQDNDSLGALVLQHHNADPESRAQVVVFGNRLVRGEPELVQDLRPVGFTYFFIDLPNGTNGGPLEVSTSGGIGEVDLYVRHAKPPTLDAYDKRSDNIGTEESVVIESAEPGRYYIGLLSKGGYVGVTLSLEFDE